MKALVCTAAILGSVFVEPGHAEEADEVELMRATLIYQDRTSAPLQFASFLVDGGQTKFPVYRPKGGLWVAEVGVTGTKEEGQFIEVSIRDSGMVETTTDPITGAVGVMPFEIARIKLPFAPNRSVQVMETPKFSVAVSVSPVANRSRR